ncbi:hypothetical protein EXM63_02400 [Clostridium botulinum]|uniref:Uncharacterized protein n=1 Tax=Clostridium botulinum TaxID=1491 RepID=A0A6M0SX33_CLOBO|nr:hypothetical protein [Clostridium botulinum]NFI74358.1 hypothetical protein [Clostridium sporogenes]NFP62266.1 hypothetical protein [Clostridium sporogenes]NFU95582.1 hypothetical protein [Clostridium sporogenes]NFV67915.1 hypothetical protein [Clostridium botulinum]
MLQANKEITIKSPNANMVVELIEKLVKNEKDMEYLQSDSYGDRLLKFLRYNKIENTEIYQSPIIHNGTEDHYVYEIGNGFWFVVYNQDGDYAPSDTIQWNGRNFYNLLNRK